MLLGIIGMNAISYNVFIMFQAVPKSPVTAPAATAADITDLLEPSVDSPRASAS